MGYSAPGHPRRGSKKDGSLVDGVIGEDEADPVADNGSVNPLAADQMDKDSRQ